MMLHYVHKLRKRNLEKVIGLFVLSALGILTLVFLLIGAQQDIFSKRYNIHTAFNEGYGLQKGSPVNLAGVEAGNIVSLQFNKQNMVDVTLGIQKKYKTKIKTDSVARVVSHGLMGNMGLSISIGSLSKPVVEEGGSIQGLSLSKTNGMLASINPIFAKAGEALSNVIYLTNRLNYPLSKIDQILEKLNEASEGILEGKGIIGTLLNDKKLFSNIAEMVGSSKRLLRSLDNAARDIQTASKRFPELIDKADTSMVELHKSAERLPYLLADGQELISNVKSSTNELNKLIKDGSGQMGNIKEILKDFKMASTNLPDIIRTTQENIDEITRIIEGSEKNWVIKGFIERKKKDKPINADMRDGHYKETNDD